MATIKTNNRSRSLFYIQDVPVADREDIRKEYDWMDYSELDYACFLKYKGSYYALADFLRLDGNEEAFKGWDGYIAETAFSGLVIKVVKSAESVIVGRYYY
jgi:hypothetical protein